MMFLYTLPDILVVSVFTGQAGVNWLDFGGTLQVNCRNVFMNRFLKRGLISLAAGVALNVAGFAMKEHNLNYYGWLMVAGVILFGIGFILTFYSLVRKVEAQGLIEERAEEKEKKKRFRLELKKPKKVSPAS